METGVSLLHNFNCFLALSNYPSVSLQFLRAIPVEAILNQLRVKCSRHLKEASAARRILEEFFN